MVCSYPHARESTVVWLDWNILQHPAGWHDYRIRGFDYFVFSIPRTCLEYSAVCKRVGSLATARIPEPSDTWLWLKRLWLKRCDAVNLVARRLRRLGQLRRIAQHHHHHIAYNHFHITILVVV